ncbi:MAG: GNAT family N-acetyltransferase [Muribaculaceae bacterium]|nr:GNAT family N-acetyltransferase [Muribaculaceae bacterium]
MLRELTAEEIEYLYLLKRIKQINVLAYDPEDKDWEESSDVARIVIYISDDFEFLLKAQDVGRVAIACLDKHYKEQEKKGNLCLLNRYAVENLSAIDEDYLIQVYCHSKGIPQVITTTDKLIIRELSMSDLDALLEIYETNEKTAFFQSFYDNREEAAAYLFDYIRNVYDFYGFGIWGICLKEDSGTADDIQEAQMIDLSKGCSVIGIIGLTPREDALELGYALAKAYQGRQYIVEAREAVIKYAKEVLGHQEIIEITQKNK